MFDLKNNTRKKRNFLFSSKKAEEIKNDILGKKYELSLVLVGDKLSTKINSQYRNKNYPTNILSFPIDTNSGEIFINLNKVEKEAGKFNLTSRKFLIFLFIHGLVHLKGYEHQTDAEAKKMEKVEKKFRKKFL